MISQSLYHTFQRYRTLSTNKITALPVLILMPHSACNCRCVMCDIWKGNHQLKQLTENDLLPLLSSLKKFSTKQVLLSGGEALLHPRFFELCRVLKRLPVHITLHSTGLLLKKHAAQLLGSVDDLIISLDGDEETHDAIRKIPGAYRKLREGMQELKLRDPSYRITGRTVIHKLNFRVWPDIIRAAKELGLDQVSFLPADVSSQAFNRELPWNMERQAEVGLSVEELPELKAVIDKLIQDFAGEFKDRFIAESPAKLTSIYTYYSALHGRCSFPYKKCNAPWVSAVIEPDGSVRPCFFHESVGNIRTGSLPEILNGDKALNFRKHLNMETNEICKRCVCYLNLPASMNPAHKS